MINKIFQEIDINFTKLLIMTVIIVIIFLLLLATIIFSQKKKKTLNTLHYRKKYLLTKNEYSFFQMIKPVVQKKHLHILCKIRLADLIEPLPNSDRSEWFSDFNKIKSKHIDFALADDNMHIILLIELEDRSHEKTERIERDDFVSSVLIQVGYKLICVHNDSTAVKRIESELSNEI